jgi:hypothetical protein
VNESIVKPVYLIYAHELRGLSSEIQTDVVQSQIKTFITPIVVTVSVVLTLKYILHRQSMKYVSFCKSLLQQIQCKSEETPKENHTDM